MRMAQSDSVGVAGQEAPHVAAALLGIRSERELAGAAYALARGVELTGAELDVERVEMPAAAVARLRDLIASGHDPLGEAFCALRSAKRRRSAGAVYTPMPIVAAMVRWAHANGDPVRVVDPGAGSGRFLSAAARAFPTAALIAVEIDPLAALVFRANAAVLGFAARLRLVVGDFRNLTLGPVHGPTLFVGNPPYVRHHDIEPSWKDWLHRQASGLGYRASKLAGLHVHFLLKTRLLARHGDYGVFITSAEWLDVNYGDLVRRLLVRDLGGLAVHRISPAAAPFAATATTAAITSFRVGYGGPMRLRAVRDLEDFALAGGVPVARSRLERAVRWSPLLRSRRDAPLGFVELGELCRVHRGQVTGCNRVWIADARAQCLPPSLLRPTVTRAKELFAAAPVLRSASGLKCVVDLPADLDMLGTAACRSVEDFLTRARASGADRSYMARHRRAWWAVGLKPAAPILCTYMARRSPAFVRNPARARHLNIAHGLYPRDPLPESLLDALALWLQGNVGVDAGRTYAGGLTKFEPREVERIMVPPPDELLERTAAQAS